MNSKIELEKGEMGGTQDRPEEAALNSNFMKSQTRLYRVR